MGSESLQDLVVGVAKASVVRVPNEVSRWETGGHHIWAAVGGVVVDHPHLQRWRRRVGESRGQALLQQVARIPADDNDRDVVHGWAAAAVAEESTEAAAPAGAA